MYHIHMVCSTQLLRLYSTRGQRTVGLSADPRGRTRSATRVHRSVEWGQTRMVLAGEGAGWRVLRISGGF